MTFDLFAYSKAADDHTDDVRRKGIPLWRVGDAVAWAAGKGHDTVLLERTGSRPSSTRYVTHHVCTDADCPGGCE